ncbi:hypothetical protein [Mycobacteroides chelonae]|uniref:hypothetical protein n=1 Tax=Mycobacteroides chelonae TaxID=1774 RepID=UPI0008A88F18|nr:hypothetical protein [Mycobacteroides chelonae]OHU12825.1 hypothetical protein BKG75_17590 [Mycobacteroides chelonae]
MAISGPELEAVFGMGKLCQATTGVIKQIDEYIAKNEVTGVGEGDAPAEGFVTALRKCRNDLEAAAEEVQAAAVGSREE